jgi:hypothetical protein
MNDIRLEFSNNVLRDVRNVNEVRSINDIWLYGNFKSTRDFKLYNVVWSMNDIPLEFSNNVLRDVRNVNEARSIDDIWLNSRHKFFERWQICKFSRIYRCYLVNN